MHQKSNRRCIYLCLILVAGLSCLSVQLIRIQLVDRKKYADSADSSYKRKRVLSHRRGLIIDRNDEVIAKDIPLKSVYVDKYQFLDPIAAARSLACKYLRDVIGEDPKSPEGRVFEDCLEVLLTDEVRSFPHWKAIPERKRKTLVIAGARLLTEHLELDEIKKRNVSFIIEEFYRPLGVSKKELAGYLDLESKRKRILVKKELSWESMRAFEKLTKENWVQGFEVEESVRREYLAPETAPHVVGFTNHQRVGQVGVEGQWNARMMGRDGYIIRKTDSRGQILPWDAETLPPKHGLDVRLTLDMRIQSVVEEELQAGMDYYQCEKGAVIVMDPKTGEVLAMASRPHFNLNNREKVVEHGFNYAIQASNETGSTIKIVATAAAMNEGLATYDSTVNSGWGVLQERGFKVKDHHPYGELTLWQVLQKSSNTGVWQFAKMLGAEKFYDYAEQFGYGRKTGIGLVGESRGGLGNTGNRMDFSRCSYGYVLTASPLQIAAAYSVIANDGVYIPPYIVKDVHAHKGRRPYIGAASKRVKEGTRRVLKPEVARDMRRALLQVTTNKGTARRARAKGYIVGGKTGTNHKVDPKTKQFDRDKYITSFAGMCPAEHPDFVCVVVMDNPQLREVWDDKKQKMVPFKRGGGSVAAPIFSKLVKRIAPLRGLQPIFEESE